MRFRTLILHPDKTPSACVAPLSVQGDFECVTVGDETSFLQLLPEWRPALVIVDCYPISEPFLHRLKDLKNRFRFGLIHVAKSYDLNLEILSYRYHTDHFLLQATPFESVHPRAKNLCLQALHFGEEALPRSARQQPRTEFFGIVIDPLRESATIDGRHIHLTRIEFQLLMAISSHQGEIITREWLKSVVWKGRNVSPRSIDAQITKLKRKLPPLEDAISAVYGRGYEISPRAKSA